MLVKHPIKLVLVTALLAGAVVWYAYPANKKPCIQDWLSHTESLFENALSVFSKDSEDALEQGDPLDERIQSLLPSQVIDLSLPQEEGALGTSAGNEDDKALLPNLFVKKDEPKTQIKGQVHMDENDKIIGAEVQVAIPTN